VEAVALGHVAIVVQLEHEGGRCRDTASTCTGDVMSFMLLFLLAHPVFRRKDMLMCLTLL
jgi:hypothetical protein